ncbi:MAG: hypothetical protein GH151_05130 [Bacteroidetes bacterium]|nr:hypothetical protein [Bacteroidota bacterium]
MKKTLLYLIVGLMLTFVACDPIENRDELGDIVPASEFQFTITQDPQHDYIVYLSNTTPYVLFSWDYAWGQTLRQQDTVRMLVPGTYTVKITATTAGGIVTTEENVTVTHSDPDAFQEPEWAMLTNMAAGKTWVWDTDLPGAWGNGGYKGCFAPCWWVVDAAGLAGQKVLNDEMTFDLNAGRNLTLTAELSPEPGITKGAFDIDMTSVIEGWSVGTLTTKNVTIIHGVDVNHDNSKYYDYNILKLTESELQVAAAQPGTGNWGEAWFWMFKPKE